MLTSRSLTFSKCFLKLLFFSLNFNLQFRANWSLKLDFKCFQLGPECVDLDVFKGKHIKMLLKHIANMGASHRTAQKVIREVLSLAASVISPDETVLL